MGFVNTYGEFVKIHGKKMCVSVEGTGDEVLLIFPCSDTPSPILEMKALVSFLSKKYTVVTVEGFGSGQSDNPNTVRTVQNIAKEVHSVLQKLGFTQYSIISDIPTVLYSMSYIQEYLNEVKSLILIDMTSSRSFMKKLIFKDTSLFARLRYLFGNTVFAKKCTRILAKISLLRVKGYVYSKHDIFTYELLSVLQLSRDFSPEITAKRQNDTSMSSVDILLLVSRKSERLLKKRKIQTNEMFADCKLKTVIFKGKGKIHLQQPERAAHEIEQFLDAFKIPDLVK